MLIADDHELMRQGVAAVLRDAPGIVVVAEAQTALKQSLLMLSIIVPDDAMRPPLRRYGRLRWDCSDATAHTPTQ